jgi:tetratricopeptide (TPR) repeat protein
LTCATACRTIAPIVRLAPIRPLLPSGLVVLLSLCSASFALAQPPEEGGDAVEAEGAVEAGAGASVDGELERSSEEQEARRRYAQGAEFFRRGRYAQAIAEFLEAYRLWDNPAILYALGQAYEGDSQVREAIDAYRRYLDATPEDDARRADVDGRIAMLEGLLATVRVRSNVRGQLYVNDALEGEVPGEFRLATGSHRLEVRAEGYAPARQNVVIAAGTTREVSFELNAIEHTTEILQVTERRRLPRAYFYGAVGVTGAALLATAGVGTTSLVKARRYDDRNDSDPVDRAEGQRWQKRTDILLGVTAGLAVGTLIIGLLTDWDGEAELNEDTSARLDVAGLPGGATLEMTIRR